MSKVLLVLPCNIYVAPFLDLYVNILNELNIDFKLIYWNRDGIVENNNFNAVIFQKKIISNDGTKSKLISFFKFAKFVKKEILTEEYDKILFLSTYSWTVVLLAHFLKKNYKGKYWVDIRDYTFENICIYKYLLKKAIKNSYNVSISSVGFESFLPAYNYLKLHNIDYDSIKYFQPNVSKKVNYPIRISFIGNVRYYTENIKLIESLGNDDRFILQYYGSGSQILEKYCQDNKIQNVRFLGRFPREKTAELYQTADIINNIYGNKTIELKTALSNKLYYSLAKNIPIIVSSNTLMAKIVSENQLGFVVNNINDQLGDEINNFYSNYIDNVEKHEFKNQQMLLGFESENKKTIEEFKKFVAM